VEKALQTRLFYSGNNSLFLSNGDLYVSALLEGFRSEHLSRLVEDIFTSRLKEYTPGLSALFPYKFESGGSYESEDMINSRLSISISDLYRIIVKN
jgi:hypothetical protein